MTAAVYHRGAASTPSSRDDWRTPGRVLERVRRVGEIGLDPCTNAENPTDAEFIFTPDDDGLDAWWRDHGLVYVNPPYSHVKDWADKIVEEATHAEIISLVAARPDSRWFYSLVWDSADAVCFWRGRLRFVGAASSAPFPSCVVYHGPRVRRFARAFEGAGKVVRL